jgi:carboxymethylenebutenolidase
MVVDTTYVDIPAGGGTMRMFVAAPHGNGDHPGVVCWSDIFQLTGPMLRTCTRLAGYGFVVAAPEIYHRLEPPGTVIPFDDAGRTRGLADAAGTAVVDFDADGRVALDYLAAHPRVRSRRLLAAGFCLGGHLAFRTALQPDVLATACFYPTGIHDGALGRDADAGSLARARGIRGELLLVFGDRDPHVPAEARAQIAASLAAAGTRHTIRLYPAEHAFMRDEGPRYDPEATDEAWREMITLFRRAAGGRGS